jgi:NADH-ubiquinone oxidoreductase chain 2
MIIPLGLGDQTSVEVLCFYMIQYFFTSINVFFIVIAFGFLLPNISSIYSPIQLISQLIASFQKNPLLSLCFTISLFSMGGIPPLIGFTAKALILLSVLNDGYFFIALIIILTSVISIVYLLTVIRFINFESSSENVSNQVTLSSPLAFIISTITLAILLFMVNPTSLLNAVHLFSL